VFFLNGKRLAAVVNGLHGAQGKDVYRREGRRGKIGGDIFLKDLERAIKRDRVCELDVKRTKKDRVMDRCKGMRSNHRIYR